MNKEKMLELINRVFDVNLTEGDYERDIVNAVKWDSFLIMAMLTEVMEQYQSKVDLEKLFSAKTIRDLVVLLVETVEGK